MTIENRHKVLVAGGAGYIGSHCCKALSQAGFEPVTVDNLCRGHRWAVRWGPLEVADIGDSDAIAALVQRYRPVAVIHLAAYGFVGESMDDPVMYYENNVAASLGLLRGLLRGAGDHPPGVIFSSSCASYGNAADGIFTEDTLQAPISTYGFSKLVVERMLADLDRAHGMRSVSLRYFNAAGADPDGELGESHEPEFHIIPSILRSAAEGQPIVLNGDDYDTPDGTCIRDFVHVSDLADAHVKALEALLSGQARSAYNLGTGKGTSLRELVDAIARITRMEIPVTIGPRRPGDPDRAVALAELARQDLGWTPAHSSLDSILGSAWSWFRSAA